MTPITIHNSRVWWAKRASKGKRGGPASSNSFKQPRTDAKLLAEQAMGYGWLNGKRLPKQVKQ